MKSPKHRPESFAVTTPGRGLRADRERALLFVAYEILARRSELVALELRDIEFWPNGTGQALIRRGKTDADAREGAISLARDGEVAEDLVRGCEDRGGGGISAVNWRGSDRRCAPSREYCTDLQAGGAVDRDAGEVGSRGERARNEGRAAQDFATLDIDLAAITQAGGWKSTRMPLQYAEKINAARSGMARAAEKSGRNSIGA